MSDPKTNDNTNIEEQEKNEEDSLFFSVPGEPQEEEPAFGELIFGEKMSGKRMEVRMKRAARETENAGMDTVDAYENPDAYLDSDAYADPEAYDNPDAYIEPDYYDSTAVFEDEPPKKKKKKKRKKRRRKASEEISDEVVSETFESALGAQEDADLFAEDYDAASEELFGAPLEDEEENFGTSSGLFSDGEEPFDSAEQVFDSDDDTLGGGEQEAPEEASLTPEEQARIRRQKAREQRRAQFKKELEEQLRLEQEEQERLYRLEQEELERQRQIEEQERRKQEEKLRREREKQEEKARREKEKQEAKKRKEQERQEARIRREQIKQTAEYRRRAKIRRIVISIVVLIVLIAAAIFLIDRYVKLRGYSVVSGIDMTNLDENSEVYKYHNGYAKCAGDGVTYFDRGGIIWSESLSMADPIFDICGEYIVASDMKSTEVYVYGPSGFIDKFSLTRVVTDVEVSDLGTVAVVTNEGDSNYIELKDKTGKDLANVKTVFSSTGYLSDIALSSDGTKLAAAFISVKDGNIESKVIFYDFSKKINQGEDVVIGEFDQYKSTLITSLHFMEGNRVAAIGDNAFTIYSVGEKPVVLYEELAYPWQINSLFMSNRFIGFVVENDEGEDAYAIKAYNLNGKLVCDQSFDFAYNHVSFAGNAVLLYSNYDCDVYNFAGTHKFSYSFDNRIFTLESCGDTTNYILLTQGQTQFIRLR